MSAAWYVGWYALIVLVGCGGRSSAAADAEPAGDAGSGGDVQVVDEAGGRESIGGRSSDGAPRCVPGQAIACACADGWEGSQICNEDGRYEPCICPERTLDWFRVEIVGTWTGTRTTPWQDGALPVTLEFTDDGTWSGTCESDDACPVLYYGSDEETSENTYRFTSMDDDRHAHGRITLTWLDAGITEGDLRDVHFEADETKLYFDFWATWAGEYGPISFALTRQQ